MILTVIKDQDLGNELERREQRWKLIGLVPGFYA